MDISKKLQISTACVLLAFIWIGTFTLYQKNASVFEGFPHLDVGFYDDTSDGGNSKVHGLMTDSVVEFVYSLHGKRAYPYAALVITFDTTEVVDLSLYDSIVFEMSSTNSRGITTQFKNEVPNAEKIHPEEQQRLFQQDVSLDKLMRKRSLSLNNYVTPDWWSNQYNQVNTNSDKFFYQAIKLELAAAKNLFIDTGVVDTLRLKSVTLKGENKSYFGIAMLLTFFILIPFFLRRIKRALHKSFEKNYGTQNYQQRPDKDHQIDDWIRIVEFVGKNYHDSELSIIVVARELKLTQSRVNDVIKIKFEGTFKNYLNEIRLIESARLIKDTSEPINQIAYDVGFGTVSHFNRVFKEKFSVPPSQYRDE